jgi:hypothetical protein
MAGEEKNDAGESTINKNKARLPTVRTRDGQLCILDRSAIDVLLCFVDHPRDFVFHPSRWGGEEKIDKICIFDCWATGLEIRRRRALESTTSSFATSVHVMFAHVEPESKAS